MVASTYAEAVGSFVRSYRQANGITLESVALVGRDYGATWSLSSIQAIEGGKAAPTLPTLLMLALALGKLSGQPLRLADLLGPAEQFERPYVMSADQPVRRSWVERVLTGAPVVLTDDDFVHARERGESEWADSAETEMDSSAGLPEPNRYDHVDALWAAMNEPPEPSGRSRPQRSSSSLAESRAAKKLGITPLVLQRVAARLWGRTLEDEAQQRAGVESTPQARGRVTRVLVDEIRDALEGEV